MIDLTKAIGAVAATVAALGGSYTLADKFGFFDRAIIEWSPENFKIVAEAGKPITVTVARIKKRDDCSVESFTPSIRDAAGMVHEATTTGNITVRGDGVEGGQITLNNLGNTAGPLILDVDGGGNGRLFTTANNANLIIGQLVGTGGYVSLNTVGSERMRVDSGGNVNIGAQAATAAGGIRYLDIYNTENTSGASATDIRLITQNAAGSGTTTLDLIKYKSGAFYISNAETGSGGIIGFNTASTERARIDASGNFMVGTTSATGLLSVAGLVYGQMVATDRFGLLGNNLYYGSGNFRYVGNGHAYGWAQGNTDGADLRLLYAGNNTSGGGAVASPTERIYITAAGNVGIGASSPDANAKLDVAGTIRSGVGGSDPGTGTALYFVGSGAFQSVIAGAAFAVHTGNNNARTERMRIDINGLVANVDRDGVVQHRRDESGHGKPIAFVGVGKDRRHVNIGKGRAVLGNRDAEGLVV